MSEFKNFWESDIFLNQLTYFSFFLTGELMFLNEATLLDNIKNRYYKDKIYVSLLLVVGDNT